MIHTFMEASGLFFWAIIILIIAIDIGLLSSRDGEPAVVAAILTSAVFIFVLLFTDAFTGWRWWQVVGLIAMYAAAGAVWSLYKWYNYLIASREEQRNRHEKRMPLAADNKSRITGWIALWPFSFSWWVLTWPREIATIIYTQLSKVYDGMARKVFDVTKD